jgi:hypothetical protein
VRYFGIGGNQDDLRRDLFDQGVDFPEKRFQNLGVNRS